ncbi:hypothetical protein ACFV0T_00960 [Streptomyces sp. NPDC059582]|uniref:hypothetical protein n=1 Tax=Streptomyces sp. NPDC059582 TaxID=3346875 RepID=UPI0036A0CBCF
MHQPDRPNGSVMKKNPDDENEVRPGEDHQDTQLNRVTPVARFEPHVALAVVSTLASLVQRGHALEGARPTPPGELQRAQLFEEGHVYLLEPPFEGYFADRYLMDFYDVRSRDLCSRMHIHTGLRFVRMMTGPRTAIRVSSFSPMSVGPSIGWTGGDLQTFADDCPGTADEPPRTRYNVVVPENSWVDMQIPRGVSHQFNADGPHAVIDSVHPEESIETLREAMSGYRMMAQTIFLAEQRSTGETCFLDGHE